jgi:protein-tyrosine-phosphatase
VNRTAMIVIAVVCGAIAAYQTHRMIEGNAMPALGQPKQRPLRVLFVCVENSNRSQMAEAFARLHGGDTVEAYSAGSKPSGKVNPKAIAAMKELGYDMSRHVSKSLDEVPNVEYDAAITMGCGDECPTVRANRREDWKIPDPKTLEPEQFNEIRDLIGKKVKELLDDLRK